MFRASAAILLLYTSVLAADTHTFPYQAVVAADSVEVRCGPGTGASFYVTMLLKRGAQVSVHRHDPGGWYMIAPPDGSFCYVDASQVRQISSDRGAIHLPPVDGQPPQRVAIRIGSELTDDCSAAGRYLAHSNEVQILGRATVRTENGPVEMLRIAPPPQEFRWVRGEYIVPLDEEQRLASRVDPYQVPADLKPHYIAQQREEKVSRQSLAAPVATADAPLPAPDLESATDTRSQPDTPQDPRQLAFSQLGQIDQRYQSMMQADPTTWNLPEIEAAYRELQKSAPASIGSLIEQRLAALAPRKEIAERLQRFVQLTAATDERDAALASRQSIEMATGTGPDDALNGTIAPFDTQQMPGIELGAAASIPSTSPAFTPVAALPQAGSAPPSGSFTSIGRTAPPQEVEAKLDGAGIVRPTYPPNPGLPPFQLVAPNGRVLAFLDPERHIPLQQFIGTATGIIGRRVHNPRLGLDIIKVQRTIPVQLAQ